MSQPLESLNYLVACCNDLVKRQADESAKVAMNVVAQAHITVVKEALDAAQAAADQQAAAGKASE
jgi:hypothetical protein